MSRSISKGPFIAYHLLKKLQGLNAKKKKMQETLYVEWPLVLSVKCIHVSSVERQIAAKLWKYWIVGKQSVHCAAVTSKVYLHSKD